MNKQISLTTIKERVKSFNDDPQLYGVVMTIWEMNLLLEIIDKQKEGIEEKDKALAFYADKENYTIQEIGRGTKIQKDHGDIARKALNTSSNNKGENTDDTRTN